MNILHIREKLSRGGIEILLFDLCKNARAHGLEIRLATFCNGEFDNEFEQNNVSLIKLNRKYPIDISLIKSLRKVITENKIVIVHSHQAIEGLHAYLATRGSKVKNIISHHGSTYPMKDKLAMKFLIPRVEANIVVSNSYLKRLYEEEGFNTKDNFYRLYNGIDESKLMVNSSRIGVHIELGIPKSVLLLGMVGNFNSGRDQLTICKALPQLYEWNKNIHFIFVGGGDSENSKTYNECYQFCKNKKILKRTHFLGSRSDIGNILTSLDVFIYSSNHDTFGIAVIEAMIAGKPVIVNDIPPMLEITGNGKYAEVFQTKNYNSLAKSIQKLVKDKLYRNYLGEEGKNWALKNFSITKHIQQLSILYKSLLN